MYRLIMESLLGLQLEGDKLHLAPCLPADWAGLKIHYRYRETVYHIAVTQMIAGDTAPHGVMRLMIDGVEQVNKIVPLLDDRREHWVEITIVASSTFANPRSSA